MIERFVALVNGNAKNFHSQIITVQTKIAIAIRLNVNTQIVVTIGREKSKYLKFSESEKTDIILTKFSESENF